MSTETNTPTRTATDTGTHAATHTASRLKVSSFAPSPATQRQLGSVLPAVMGDLVAEAQKVFDQLVDESANFSYALRANGMVLTTSPGHENALDMRLLVALLQGEVGSTQVAAAKKFKNFVDVVENVALPADFNIEAAAALIKDGVTPEAELKLPPALLPAAKLQAGEVMQLLVGPAGEDGKRTIVKHCISANLFLKKNAEKLVTGRLAHVPWRQNTYGARKAFQQMLHLTVANKVLFALNEPTPQTGKRMGGNDWKPTAEEVEAGIAVIRKRAPVCGGLEQLQWIWTYSKAVYSPVSGWPMTYVQQAVVAKVKCKRGAEVQTEFPLTV